MIAADPKVWPVRRRFKRHEMPNKPATIVAWTFARLFDVSLSGLSVETPTLLKIGKTYSFDLSEGNDVLMLNGKVVWSKYRGTRMDLTGELQPVYQAGVLFIGILPENEQPLIEFIEKNADVSACDKLFARLFPLQGEPKSIESKIGVKITRLSPTRLLFESELALDPGNICTIFFSLEGKPVDAKLRVVSVEENRTVPPESRHLIGTQITEISDKNRSILERFINDSLTEMALLKSQHAATSGGKSTKDSKPAKPSAAGSAKPASPLRGNTKSRIFHTNSCRNYKSRTCSAEFETKDQALVAGYRECRSCGSQKK